MSTIASLLGMIGETQPRPWDIATRSQNEADTGLIQLADLKAKQAAEQQYLLSVQNDPRVREALFGGSVLGSLGTAGSPPGAAPMTQQTTMPGQPPGTPQVVPGGQDLSQFATQGGPPQSTIASLGAQPQGGMPGAQSNPALEMARTNPRAAMMLNQQLQQAQKQQWDMQEKRLDWGVKISEYVARMLQGVTDQASLDDAREKIRQVHPQAAAQVPQMYSKEAVASVQQRGIAIADRAKNLYDEARARKADMETQMFPELIKRFGTDGTEQPPAGGTAPAPSTASGPRTAGGGPPPESDATRAIRAEAIRQDVDPDLAVAVATQESYLHPNAVGDGGKGLGYFQLHRGAAIDAKIDPDRRHEPALNIQGGVTYLKQKLAQTKGNVDEALKLYNGGGDPNYVANVRKFLPGGTPASGGGTAQAPAADPRVAQLERQIASKTNDAKIASLMGNESLSTRLNDEANRLKDERDKVLEPSRAGARTTAETEARNRVERARQEEPLLPEEQRTLLRGLRGDICQEPTHKTYQDVRNGYQNVRIGAESNSSQGDLAIVNGIAKILDPGSVVMTGEARNVEEAQGQLQRWLMSPERFFEGDRLTPENRQRFLKLAHSMATEKLTTAEKELRAVYEPIAKKAGLDFTQLLPIEPLKPLAPGSNVGKFEKLLQ